MHRASRQIYSGKKQRVQHKPPPITSTTLLLEDYSGEKSIVKRDKITKEGYKFNGRGARILFNILEKIAPGALAGQNYPITIIYNGNTLSNELFYLTFEKNINRNTFIINLVMGAEIVAEMQSNTQGVSFNNIDLRQDVFYDFINNFFYCLQHDIIDLRV